MQFTAVVAALAFAQAAVAAPSSAPVVVRDAHKLDFRSFGVAGCFDENQGVWTLTESANTRCTRFTEAVGSILVADNLCTCESFILLSSLLSTRDTNGQWRSTPTLSVQWVARSHLLLSATTAPGSRSR